MKFLTLVLTLTFSFTIFAQTNETPNELRPFKSDFCSKFPEGKDEDPSQWAGCCFTHDLNYWIGGTEDERKTSDQELRECVKLTGAGATAFLMYFGVRVGGKPGEADYAWGYGWAQTREYEKIPHEDLLTAKSLLENSEYNQQEDTKELVTRFLEDILAAKLSIE